jgi:hypothetical protein
MHCFFGNRVTIGYAINLIYEAQHLAITQGNHLVVFPGFGYRESKIPPRFS